MTFIIGQRWISNSESQLGLGIITESQRRQVSINFPAAEEERIYAIDNAPLSRIIFKEGEHITTNDSQTLIVTGFKEQQGLLIYTAVNAEGESLTIPERALSCFISLSSPQQRLYSGLLDKLNAYKLRVETLFHASRLKQSPVCGLLGSRTNHLPHQVYIAHEVAQRYAPRVLLADEVGLGKTIEAGMILHYQLHTGRASRILIVVPDTLIHQWLVEMIRRFNLYFSIFDNQRISQEHGEDFDEDYPEPKENVFESEQLVLCSLDFLMNNEEARAQAASAEWDLLIVDEAHHLQWTEQAVSPQYQCIEELAAQSKGLLLLTATPEQVGIESHFARLRLLDPSRFHDFELFKQEEAGYKAINNIVQQLNNQPEGTQTSDLDSSLKNELKLYLGKTLPDELTEVIRNLLDRHGTGRVLFRNTRAAIKGFPQRAVHAYPLPLPEVYHPLTNQPGILSLYPETEVENLNWLEEDPRVAWLATKLDELYPEKVLIICAKARTAIALEQQLKLKTGIRTTSFHEGLSIIERDRAAAYFAEEDEGAQALICSEIGSEGRNFQFAHHLVLFDLPLNPDLLEQRIGRLDRIGQRLQIEIHVPYLEHTAQEQLFRWYHEGINLFTQSCSVGFAIFEAFKNRLLDLLDSAMNTNTTSDMGALIKDTQSYVKKINLALHEGRDRLLELNSCNLPVAEELISAIEAEENDAELEHYMAKVFHEYGIDHEYHSDQAEIIRPTEHMKTSHFPGLKEDGATATYSRQKALVREDMEFLSWEHPMVNQAMEMILDSELGNATLTTLSLKSIPSGTLFIETFFTINCAAPKQLQLDRFLPATPIRILMDISGKNLAKVLDFNKLNDLCEQVKRHLGYPIISQIRTEIEFILKQSTELSEQELLATVTQAQTEMKEHLSNELNRLKALKKINPSIRNDELSFIKNQIKESTHYIEHAALKLQAVRVVINK